MPSTYASRAIGSYRAQVQTNSTGLLYDRTTANSAASRKEKKESFAEILREHVRKHANDTV